MPDFKQLLSRPAGEGKKPQALNAGDYPAIIKSYELGDANKNKTPYVRYHIAYTGWPNGEPQTNEDGEAIDLSKRQGRRDYYLTEDAFWRLDDFLTSHGIDLTGRSYEETLPEAVGKNVIAEVQQYMNQQTNEIGNQIGALKPAE